MTLHRYAKKRDLLEPEIVKALKAAGCKVWKLDRPFDLLVGLAGRFTVLEVKSKARLNRADQAHQSQELADAQAGGLPAYRVVTVEDALQAMGLKH